MNILRIHHVGIVVRDLDAALEAFSRALGLPALALEEWQGTARVAIADVGGTLLHLIQPLEGTSLFAAALRERGEGPHHVAVEVGDLLAALRLLSDAGIRVLDARPRRDPGDAWAVFVDPRDTGGVLMELVQQIVASR